MGTKAEKAMMNGFQFGWGFLDSDQKELMTAVLRILKSLPDEKILEIGKRVNK